MREQQLQNFRLKFYQKTHNQEAQHKEDESKQYPQINNCTGYLYFLHKYKLEIHLKIC